LRTGICLISQEDAKERQNTTMAVRGIEKAGFIIDIPHPLRLISFRKIGWMRYTPNVRFAIW